MSTARSRFFGLLVGIAIALPVYAQQTGVFAGTVIGRDGKPISGATVVIERPETGLKLEAKTDRSGRYIRSGLDDGNYLLTVIQNGVTVASAPEKISLGFRVDHDFDLRTIDKQQGSAGGATISKVQRDAETKANTETQGAFNAGLNALTAGNFDEAVKQFNLAAERRPNLPVTYNRLGETYMAAKKYNEAADAYKKAIELKPDDADYFFNLGVASSQAGKDKDAVDAMQRSIKQNPKNASAYYELGLILMKNTATIPDSAAQFERFLQLEPTGQRAETAKGLLAAAKAAGGK